MSDGSGASGAPPNSVRLVVQEGLEAYLPLADLMDADKERARLGKQAKTPPSSPSPSPSPNSHQVSIYSHPGLYIFTPWPLGTQAKTLQDGIEKLEKRLNGPGFADKAPPAVVAKAQGELDEQRAALAAVNISLNELPSA